MSESVATPTVFAADLICYDFLDSVNIEVADDEATFAETAGLAVSVFRSRAPYEYEDGMLEAEDITEDLIRLTELPSGD